MNPKFRQAARSLVAGDPDVVSAPLVADRAVQAFEQLASHLARLLGDAGVQQLLKRSFAQASVTFAWLPVGASPNRPTSALREVMEKQDLESSIEAFVAVLTAFVGLLERLIGEALAARLLDEVWPSVFAYAGKDTP